MINICAVVVAAGKGVRLQSKISKPLVRLGPKNILAYSLQTLSECADIKSIIVVANRSNLSAVKRSITSLRLPQVSDVVQGGERRQDSVRSGLDAVPAECNYVLIHDAARPFLDSASLKRLIIGVRKTGAAILGVPVKCTIKETVRQRRARRQVVKATLDRERLWEIQTPQAFRKDIILKAYNSFGMINVTDDSALVEKLAIPVSMVMGSYMNIKITTPEDIHVAAALLEKRRVL
jgi:2-C-methyl-D-erythritol 4-phosphate cytidylyltransferase